MSDYLTVITDFLNECYKIRDSFTSDVDVHQESLEIAGILSQIKLYIVNRFSRDS
ncbi:unnamed protein product, partial [marine sediment metagenome]